MPSPRYAIYYAPEPGSGLAGFGARWLGRDAEAGVEVPRPAIDGIDPGRLAEITADPRRYGFHGTLKAPIRLATGKTIAGLEQALARFAEGKQAFSVPALRIKELGSFLGLVPTAPYPALRSFAAECVTRFDEFRAPPTTAEREKRVAAGLSARQMDYLNVWGYPYVREEFRFHLSLTGRIPDEQERHRLAAILTGIVEPLCGDPLQVDAVCLFEQPAETEPFVVRSRFRLG